MYKFECYLVKITWRNSSKRESLEDVVLQAFRQRLIADSIKIIENKSLRACIYCLIQKRHSKMVNEFKHILNTIVKNQICTLNARDIKNYTVDTGIRKFCFVLLCFVSFKQKYEHFRLCHKRISTKIWFNKKLIKHINKQTIYVNLLRLKTYGHCC